MIPILIAAPLCAAAALALSGCGAVRAITLPPEATPLQRLEAACADVTPAYLAFTTWDLIRPVGAKTRAAVDAAYGQATAICAAPPTDPVAQLVALNRAIAAIRDARRAA